MYITWLGPGGWLATTTTHLNLIKERCCHAVTLTLGISVHYLFDIQHYGETESTSKGYISKKDAEWICYKASRHFSCSIHVTSS